MTARSAYGIASENLLVAIRALLIVTWPKKQSGRRAARVRPAAIPSEYCCESMHLAM